MPVIPVPIQEDPDPEDAIPWESAGPVEASLLSGQVIVAGFTLTWTSQAGWSPVIHAGFTCLASWSVPNRWTAGSIVAGFTLSANWNVNSAPSTTPQGQFVADGYLPSFPMLVYATSVSVSGSSVTYDHTVANGQSFIVSASYTQGGSGDPLKGYGCGPNFLGLKVSSSVFVFRPPALNEVVRVCFTGSTPVDQGYLKWSGVAWNPYTTQPQRNLAMQQVFQCLDPDGIYDYYASLVGGMAVEMMWDIKGLLNVLNAYICPPDYLPILGANWGAQIDATLPISVQRRQVGSAVARNKLRGTNGLLVIVLEDLGYPGCICQNISVNPNDPTDWVTTAQGTTPSPPYVPARQLAVIFPQDLSGLTAAQAVALKTQVGKAFLPVVPVGCVVKAFYSTVASVPTLF